MGTVKGVGKNTGLAALDNRRNEELVNPLIMQSRLLGQLDELFGRMQHSAAEQANVHRKRARLSQNEMEDLYNSNAWLHKSMGMGQFLSFAGSATASGFGRDDIAGFMQVLAKAPEIYKDTNLENNKGQNAHFEMLKQIDDRDEQNTRQTTQMVQSMMDEKKRLVEELARLLAESLKVKA